MEREHRVYQILIVEDEARAAKSLETLVRRYGGTLKLGVDGDIFYVNALLPLPEGQEG